MKTRFYFFIGIIALASIIGIAALASRPAASGPQATNMPTPTPGPIIITFTVTSGVGADKIIMTNLNTAATFILMQGDFPFTANCNDGDVLTFNVMAKEGYTFNAWFLNDGTWQSKNPLTFKTDGSFSMEALFLINDVEMVQP